VSIIKDLMRSFFGFYCAMLAITPSISLNCMPNHKGFVSRTSGILMGYVPDGLSKEQWEKIKNKERAAKSGLGRVGARGFKSRSMHSFQEALERGEANHLMPVNPDLVKAGKIKPEDVPYMQRGGSWDNSDIKGAKRKRWLKSDIDFERQSKAAKKGKGMEMPWTGMTSTNNKPPSRETRTSSSNREKSNPFAQFFGKK